MARIRRANTVPEWRVRRLLYQLGYRFRLQWPRAPGRPDVAFPGRRKAIFVHGCFWHAHEGCPTHRVPKTRSEFWQTKFTKNWERDQRLLTAARQLGWGCLVIWECETKDAVTLSRRLKLFLGPTRQTAIEGSCSLATAGRSVVSSNEPSSPQEAA